MSNVNLTIGGRTFAVSAAAGEESHIEMLGRMIEDRVRKSGAATQNETRMLLFAALMLADELHDAHEKEAPPAPEPVAAAPAEPSPEVIARVEALAERVEKLARHLEEQAPTS